MEGTVVRLMKDKMFGFIRTSGGTDFFFHASAVKNIKFVDLSIGMKVQFEEGESPKGPRAEDIYV